MKFRSRYLHTIFWDVCEFCENSVQGKAVFSLWAKLTGSQLVKKFPAFHGTRTFITAFTSAHLIQLDPVYTLTSHFLKIHLNIILPHTPGSFKWSLSLRFPTKTFYTPLLSPISATCPAPLILLDFITRITFGEEYSSEGVHYVVFSIPLFPRPS